MTFTKFVLNEGFENYMLIDKRKVGSREIAQWEKVSAAKPNDLRPFGVLNGASRKLTMEICPLFPRHSTVC